MAANAPENDDTNRTVESIDRAVQMDVGDDAGGGTIETSETPIDRTIDSAADLGLAEQAVGDDDGLATVDSQELSARAERQVTAMWGDGPRGGGPLQTIKGKTWGEGPRATTLVVQRRAFRSLDTDAAPRPQTVADYDLVRVLGEGGMGVVYSARQASIDRTVAIKMLKSRTAGDEQQRHKFLAEAVITGDLEHPNIVPIYDLGTNDDGALFYSMKCVQGTPWDKRIRELSLQENLEILMKVADAVAFAHARNVIHRDLKPENTMLGDFGEVLVMDWGLAIPTGGFQKSHNITPSVTMGGTPAYMAPEMALGPLERISCRSDVYLLGAILYECITGKPPHRGPDIMACLRAAAKNQIVPTDKSGELVDIALRAMATDPEQRYGTVREFQEAIRGYLSHSESSLLTARAEQELAVARGSGEYQDYAQSVFAFQEALNLWSENEPARVGLGRAKLAYAQVAYDKGDYDLGASLLDPALSEHAPLLQQIRAAQVEREARQRRLKTAKRAVLALVGLILLIVTAGLLAVNYQRGVAIAERDRAREARLAAERAQEQEQLARLDAEQAQEEERVAKEAALAAQVAEETAKLAALRAQQEEATARRGAERAREDEAKARADAQYQAYIALIGLAAAKIEENAFGAARDLLDQCEPGLRNWEWGRLAFLCQQDVGIVPAAAPLESIDVADDGSRLAAGGWNGTVGIWQLPSRQTLVSLPHGPTSFVNAVAFAPGGHLLATGSNDTAGGYLRLWDADSGQLLRTCDGHEDAVLSVAFSPDGQWLLSSSYDGTARLWDAATGRLLRTFAGHDWWVWSAAFSPDAERIVTASHDGTAIVWSTETGEQIGAPFMGHWQRGSQMPVYTAAFSPDGRRVASGGLDNRVLIWDPAALQPFDYDRAIADQQLPKRYLFALEGHKAAVRSIAWSADGEHIITGSQDNTVCVWAADSGEPIKTLRGHDGWVRCCRFSADGRRVLSGSHDQTIRFWDIAGYHEARVLRGQVLDAHLDAVLAACFSADGRRVVTASRDRTAKLWDVDTAKELRQFREGHEFTTATASFFPDGRRLLTTAVDGTSRVWDVTTGAELVDLRLGGTGMHGAAAIAHGGDWILTGSRQPGPEEADLWQAKLWNAHDGSLVHALAGHQAEVTAVAFSPDDRWLFSGDRAGRCVLWDRETGAEVARFWDDDQINAAVFLPDGQTLLTANNYDAVRQWHVPDGREINQRVWRHPDSVVSLAVDRAGQWALTGCDDGGVRLWNVTEGRLVRSLPVQGGPAAMAENLRRLMKDFRWNEQQLAERSKVPAAFVSDLLAGKATAPPAVAQRLAAALEVRPAQLWKTVFSVAVSPDGTRGLTVGATDRVVRLWNLADGSEIAYPAGEAGPGPFLDLAGDVLRGLVWSASFSPGGDRVVTVGGDSARLWDLDRSVPASRRELMAFSPHGAVAAACLSPNQTYLATGSWDNTARVWQAATGQMIQRLGKTLEGAPNEHQGNVNCVDFSPDGRILLTASEDGTVKLWSVGDWKLLKTLRGHQAGVLHAVFSHDGRRVLSSSRDKTARIWDVQTGRLLRELAGHAWAVRQAAFSADDRWVVTGGEDNLALVWRLEPDTAIIAHRLQGHTAGVTSVAFSHEQDRPTRILTGSEDYTTILWDALTGREILTLKGHTREVTSACFSPDGRDVLTGSRDGTAVVWPTADWRVTADPPTGNVEGESQN
jgi:WD40 repeat protein/serine/threonine protein kinase